MAIARASIRFSTPSWPIAWAPSSRPSDFRKRDLQDDGLRARVVPRVRMREKIDLFVVLVALPDEALLAGAGGRWWPRRSRGPRCPGCRGNGSPPGDHVGRDPALPVGRPGQRDQGPFAGDVILDLDRVPDGKDVRVARPHMLVDADPAALADLEPGRLGQRGLWAHADGQNDDIRRVGSDRTW